MILSVSMALCWLAMPVPQWIQPFATVALESTANDDFPPGEDDMPEGEDEPASEPPPPPADTEAPVTDRMPEGEIEGSTDDELMPEGEDQTEGPNDLPPLAPVEASCVSPLRARGIVKIIGEKRQSIDLNEAHVEGRGTFGVSTMEDVSSSIENTCLARAQILARVNERCELSVDLVEQMRNHLQASSIRLRGAGCPDVELPNDHFLMTSGNVHFELTGPVRADCVDNARLKASGAAQLRAGTGQTTRIEFVDFVIEGDLLGQRDRGLTCGRRGRPLALGLDKPEDHRAGLLRTRRMIGLSIGVVVLAGGAYYWSLRREQPTTRIVIDLR